MVYVPGYMSTASINDPILMIIGTRPITQMPIITSYTIFKCNQYTTMGYHMHGLYGLCHNTMESAPK